MSDNFFNISDAQNRYCKVNSYQNHVLDVWVYDENGKSLFSLTFTANYLQCPMEWKGAAFRLGSLDELTQLWQELKIEMTLEDFTKYLRLFIAEVDKNMSHKKVVRILATRAEAIAIEVGI